MPEATIERFHQTLKAYLAKQHPATPVAELQEQIGTFVACYNEMCPHWAKDRLTPKAAFEARDKARPAEPLFDIAQGTRVRRDRIDGGGAVTLRHKGRLYHSGIVQAHRHKPVIRLVAGLDVRNRRTRE